MKKKAKYLITSAKYVNAENSAAVIQTKQVGAVAISEVDNPDEWELMLSKLGNKVKPYVDTFSENPVN